MSSPSEPGAARRPDSPGERPHLSTRPVTITLDVAGSQFLAVAESEHATAAVFVEAGADTAELQALFEDLQRDLPIQGRRLGVLAETQAADSRPERSSVATAEQEADSDE